MNSPLLSSTSALASVEILPPPVPVSATDEINHRVANSLQMLSALVSLESRGIKDEAARAALDMTQARIAAVAGVHRLLYQTRATSSIDLAFYLQALGADLQGTQARTRRVLVDLERVMVRMDEATSIGIIVSELANNAFKYAYDAASEGDVRLVLRAMPFGGYLLEVIDRGYGMTGDPVRGTGFGSQLIDAMVARIGGRFSYHDAQPGTRFLLFVDR